DVSTAGMLVGAFNLGGPGVANTTVNGVTFTGLAFSGPSPVTSGNFTFSGSGGIFGSTGNSTPMAPFSTLSAPYQALLSSAVTVVSPPPLFLTISGLTVGSQYQFEWWSNNSISVTDLLTTLQAGNAITLQLNTSSTIGGLGQFALGTFTADATSQSMFFFGSSEPALVSIDAVQLRNLTPGAATVPEPSA